MMTFWTASSFCVAFSVKQDRFLCHFFVNSLPFQIKCHANVGYAQFRQPLSCPLTAALSPGFPPNLGQNSSTVLAPVYLLPSGSFGGVAPVALYLHWPGTPASVVDSRGSALGLLGAARMMPYITTMAHPGMRAFPMAMHTAENGACSKNC